MKSIALASGFDCCANRAASVVDHLCNTLVNMSTARLHVIGHVCSGNELMRIGGIMQCNRQECPACASHTLSVTVNTSTVKTRVPKVQFPNICQGREGEQGQWSHQSHTCIHGLFNSEHPVVLQCIFEHIKGAKSHLTSYLKKKKDSLGLFI